jgi:hypothetical protein
MAQLNGFGRLHAHSAQRAVSATAHLPDQPVCEFNFDFNLFPIRILGFLDVEGRQDRNDGSPNSRIGSITSSTYSSTKSVIQKSSETCRMRFAQYGNDKPETQNVVVSIQLTVSVQKSSRIKLVGVWIHGLIMHHGPEEIYGISVERMSSFLQDIGKDRCAYDNISILEEPGGSG